MTAVLAFAGYAIPSAGPVRDTGKPAAGQDASTPAPPANFQAALKAAEAGRASPKGQAYEKKARQSAGAWLPSEVSRCVDKVGGTVFGPFIVLVRVGRSGKAEEVLAWPETHIADCLKPKFATAVYPKPPKQPWWIKVDVQIKFTEGEAGGEAPPAQAQAAAGIPYSGDLGVMVAAPTGWVLDNQSGVSQGTHAVMYPRGSSWRNAPEVMYVNVSKMDPGETFEGFVTADVNRFRKEFAGIKVEELEPIALRSGGKAAVRGYSGGGYESHECVAYAQYGTGAAIYVLTCRTRDGLERTIPLFRDIVARSYPVKMKFDGKKASVTLYEPAARAKDVEDNTETEGIGTKDAAPARPFWSRSGYSYWSRFKPGSFVTFRYSMKAGQVSQDMLKTVTLKEVTPDSVVLEYRESAIAQPGKSSPSGSPTPYQRSRFVFLAADEDFQKKDLFGGQLSLSPADILKDSQGREAGAGPADLDWKGAKHPVEWRRYLLGQPGAWLAMTFWLSDEVPGTVAKMTRELQGGTALKEEFVVEDFQAVRAEPAEIERLRALRKPVVVETTVEAYLAARFRVTQSLDAASRELALSTFRSNADADWVDMMLRFSPLAAKFRDIQQQLGDDEQAAAAELGAEQMAKLRPILERAGRLVGLYLKLAEFMVDYLSGSAAGEADPASVESKMAEADKLMTEISAARESYLEEQRKAADVKLKFLREPGGKGGVW